MAVQRLVGLDAFYAARMLLGYLSVGGELPTVCLPDACEAAGKRLVVPAWAFATRRYGLALLRGGERMVAGPMNVAQPDIPCWMPFALVDLAVVPGLAFDRHGGRLGHGGGYFDRLLRRLPAACVRVGLCFDWQVVDRVPMDHGDEPVDLVVTEKRMIACSRTRRPLPA